MKYIVVLVLLFVRTTFSYSQNDFHKRLLALEKINYFIVGKNISNVNWYNNQVIDFARFVSLDTIDSKSVLKMETYDIKGKKEILPKTYGRATIEKWTFKDSISASKSEVILRKAFLSQHSEMIHKAPWIFWREKSVVYFILTGGTYMKIDLKKIEKKLKKGL
jgi:hypothetical protein